MKYQLDVKLSVLLKIDLENQPIFKQKESISY